MDVLINRYNMGHIVGIQDVLPGSSIKYVIDLIFDSIIYQWGLNIPHSPKPASKRKHRLSERHLEYVVRYADQKHIFKSIAANLILDDYFSPNQSYGKSAPVAKISPISTPQTESPKVARGRFLMENLKR